MRDGDWKLVSFRSNPWELYNVAEDRTELHDQASQKPELRDRVIKLWHELAENVDTAPAKSRQPVAETAGPVRHPEWTDFTKQPGEPGMTKQRKKEGKRKKRKN